MNHLEYLATLYCLESVARERLDRRAGPRRHRTTRMLPRTAAFLGLMFLLLGALTVSYVHTSRIL
jgi:hypothetical protein